MESLVHNENIDTGDLNEQAKYSGKLWRSYGHYKRIRRYN